eukprot:scaffold117258_cov101-Phaeocystis_antarctica.AAC.1
MLCDYHAFFRDFTQYKTRGRCTEHQEPRGGARAGPPVGAGLTPPPKPSPTTRSHGRTGAGLSQMFLGGEEDHTHSQNTPAVLVRVEPEMLISGARVCRAAVRQCAPHALSHWLQKTSSRRRGGRRGSSDLRGICRLSSNPEPASTVPPGGPRT